MYFLGKYNNIRNNEYDYGFGNFIVLANNLYAFLTFDFQIKIFKINKWLLYDCYMIVIVKI